MSTSEFAGRVQLRVIDTGPGIPADRRDGLFVAFQRLGDTDNSTGVGLGLSITKAIVVAHHGELDVTSTVGVGTSFIVRLPLAA